MILLIFFLQAITAYNLVGYPGIDVIPPINQTMTELLLGNATVAPSGGPIYDYAKDTMNCSTLNQWAVTYDDGPSPLTLTVLKELSNRKIKATFFVIGSMVLKYPDILIETFKAGHEIGIHTWSHNSLVTLTTDQIIAEIMWTAKIIREVIGYTPRLVRPPYGEINEHVRSILKALGLEVIVWNRDTLDWTKNLKSNQSLNSNLSQDAFKKWLLEPELGTISLQHDINNLTVIEIPPTLNLLQNSSYSPVLISTCANIEFLYDDGIIKKLGAMTDTAIKVDQGDDKNAASIATPHFPNGNIATPQTIHFQTNPRVYIRTFIKMPIVVKEQEWTQLEESIEITVPLKGHSKADVYLNSLYLKINFPPYFFQLDLAHPVDSEHSKCTIGNGLAVVNLVKLEKLRWNDIRYTGPDDIHDRRKKAEEEALQLEKKKKEELLVAKREEERKLIQEQIEVERATRLRVESIKETQRKEAQNSLEDWVKTSKVNPEKRADSAIFSDSELTSDKTDDDIDMEAIEKKVHEQLKGKVKAQPRQSATIQVSFTSRGLLPTQTARESEDEKWRVKIKQMQDMHEQKKRLEDLKKDEMNPELLKEKGNAFFKAENYEAAMNAYTAAIELDPKNAGYLSARSAIYLKMNQPSDAMSDCVKALELLDVEDDIITQDLITESSSEKEARRKSKLKLYIRKGAAALAMGDTKTSHNSYKLALDLEPKNPELLENVSSLSKLIKP